MPEPVNTKPASVGRLSSRTSLGWDDLHPLLAHLARDARPSGPDWSRVPCISLRCTNRVAAGRDGSGLVRPPARSPLPRPPPGRLRGCRPAIEVDLDWNLWIDLPSSCYPLFDLIL